MTFINSKYFRRTLSIFLVLVAVFVVLPSLFQKHSFNAIVNTRFVAVHSPIEGRIENFNREVGDSVTINDKLLSVNNLVKNQSFINQIKALEKMKDELHSKVKLNNSLEATRIGWQIQEIEKEIDGEKKILQAMRDRIAVLRPLALKQIVDRFMLDDEIRRATQTEAKVEILTAKLQRLKLEQRALLQGVRMGEGRNDVTYTRQRMDELDVQIADIRAKINMNGGSLNDSYVLTAPATGIIWKKFFYDQSEVVIGSEIAQIVDCTKLFIESEIEESYLEKLNIGDKVKYRIFGTNEFVEGTIVNKVGTGNTPKDRTLAAELKVEAGAARIFVKVNSQDLKPTGSNMCHIGRKVELLMDRSYKFDLWTNRITGLFK